MSKYYLEPRPRRTGSVQLDLRRARNFTAPRVIFDSTFIVFERGRKRETLSVRLSTNVRTQVQDIVNTCIYRSQEKYEKNVKESRAKSETSRSFNRGTRIGTANLRVSIVIDAKRTLATRTCNRYLFRCYGSCGFTRSPVAMRVFRINYTYTCPAVGATMDYHFPRIPATREYLWATLSDPSLLDRVEKSYRVPFTA